MPPVPIDATMRGLGLGEVIESKRDDMPVGATVSGFTGWQELVLADDSRLEAPLTVLPDPLPAPLPAFLGALGHTGVTAYIGIDLAELKQGETIVISAACGAVGGDASSGSPAGRRSAPTRSRSSATTSASTTAPRTGASSSAPPPRRGSMSTSRTSAARSWTTS
jgi:hypothetical protein